MDFRNVTELIIQAGSVKKISIGGVVYWNKEISAGNKYSIMKDGVEVARVTISRLVKQVNSGYAQENYCIGAQIIIPYKEWYRNIDDLLFNFGTFTAYGKGKLGLQAHYALPNGKVPYGDTTLDNFCDWEHSYACEWLNAHETDILVNDSNIRCKNGFLGCIPEDFVDVMNTTIHNNVISKVFLPSATNLCAKPYSQDYPYTTTGDGENQVWGYWLNKIGSLQEYYTTTQTRVIKRIGAGNDITRVILPNAYKASNNKACNSVFNCYNGDGYTPYSQYYIWGNPYLSLYSYLPACVIG